MDISSEAGARAWAEEWKSHGRLTTARVDRAIRGLEMNQAIERAPRYSDEQRRNTAEALAYLRGVKAGL